MERNSFFYEESSFSIPILSYDDIEANCALPSLRLEFATIAIISEQVPMMAGEPLALAASPLSGQQLPTLKEVYQHSLHLTEVKMSSGEWIQKTSRSEKAKCLAGEVASVWESAFLPHRLVGRQGEKLVLGLFDKVRAWQKLKGEAKEEAMRELETLFDVCTCSHDVRDECDCEPHLKVPESKHDFLQDQRGPRKQMLPSKKSAALRSGATREEVDIQERNEMLAQVAKREEKEQRKRKLEEKSAEEVELLFKKVQLELSDEESENETNDESVGSKYGKYWDDESEWEDVEEEKEEKEEYNTLKLKNFAREVDRYQVSDRAAAKLANGLMIDLGHVSEGKTKFLIDHSKVRRERQKWGKKREDEHSKQQLMPEGGLYTDGKKSKTFVRDVTETKVRVKGGRGKGAFKVVEKISNKFEIQDHYPIVAQPSGEYVDHVTPKVGSGKEIAAELLTVVRERDVRLRVLGMDGCGVNVGIHRGVIRRMELELGEAIQRFICLLHHVELYFHHQFEEVDGKTLGPGEISLFDFKDRDVTHCFSDKLEGPVGSTLGEEIWRQPVVNFKAVSGKMPILPDVVVKDLSRDQHLAYMWGHAVQDGEVPDTLAGQVIGPLNNSRWLTRSIRN